MYVRTVLTSSVVVVYSTQFCVLSLSRGCADPCHRWASPLVNWFSVF